MDVKSRNKDHAFITQQDKNSFCNLHERIDSISSRIASNNLVNVRNIPVVVADICVP